MLLEALRSSRRSFPLNEMGFEQEQDDIPITDIPITDLTEGFVQSAFKNHNGVNRNLDNEGQVGVLPRVITFPYSRHSSYEELCHLVEVFDPKDVYPCTVDEFHWHEGMLAGYFNDPS